MRNDWHALLVAVVIAGLFGVVPVSVAAPEPIPTVPVPPSSPGPVWPVITPTDSPPPSTGETETQTTTKTPDPTATATNPEPTTIATKPDPPTTTTEPLRTTARPPSAGPTPVPSESPAPTLVAPATAELGTTVTVRGERWPCDLVRAFPDWSESVPAQVRGGVFDVRVDVAEGIQLGSHAISAACVGASQGVAARTFIEMIPARLGTTTDDRANPQPPGERPPSPGQAADSDRDTGVGDILGLGGFLLALGAAALVLRRRRKRPNGASHNRDPHLPQVHVRVVVDVPPLIHVRQVTRAPDVRVRLRACEPWLNVKEVLG
jgi:MYXO-CTERM domain-containing protein